MTRLAELLLQADQMPRNENGMVISACGALSIGARALKEMAELPDVDGDPIAAHETRLYEVQPLLAAHSLETMADHLALLREAVVAGNAAVIRDFFNLYVFD